SRLVDPFERGVDLPQMRLGQGPDPGARSIQRLTVPSGAAVQCPRCRHDASSLGHRASRDRSELSIEGRTRGGRSRSGGVIAAAPPRRGTKTMTNENRDKRGRRWGRDHYLRLILINAALFQPGKLTVAQMRNRP